MHRRIIIAINNLNVFYAPLIHNITRSRNGQGHAQSTGNRKARARIPAQSKASLFPQKDFKFFKMYQN